MPSAELGGINEEKSRITFSVKNLKFNTVVGEFRGMKGQARFTPADLEQSVFDVCIDAATVNTGNGKRDDHLKNEDFFDVTNHPSICFRSDRISEKNGKYIAEGRLQLLDSTHQIKIPFQVLGDTLRGDIKIKRLDYGLGRDTNKFLVGDEISIRISCVLDTE